MLGMKVGRYMEMQGDMGRYREMLGMKVRVQNRVVGH